MEQFNIKYLFKEFIHGYIANRHTVSLESEEEVERLIDEAVDEIKTNDYFTEMGLIDALEYIEQNITDIYKSLYGLRFNLEYYSVMLEDFIKDLLQQFNQTNESKYFIN